MFTNFAVFPDFATSATDMKMVRHQFAIRYYILLNKEYHFGEHRTILSPTHFVSEILGLFSKTIMEAKNEDKKVNAFALT